MIVLRGRAVSSRPPNQLPRPSNRLAAAGAPPPDVQGPAVRSVIRLPSPNWANAYPSGQACVEPGRTERTITRFS